MFMRSFAARHSSARRTLVLMAPGWVRTEMGGPEGRLSIEESVPNVVNTLLAAQGPPGFSTLITSVGPFLGSLAVRIEEFPATLLPCGFELRRRDIPVRSAFLGDGAKVLAELFQRHICGRLDC
jgi:hypothetical protein